MISIGGRTPWGPADDVAIVSPGIAWIGTASHGGLKLDRSANAAMHPALREAGGWYEEDCAASKVIFSFPHLFTAEQVTEARDACRNYFPDGYTAASGEALTEKDSSLLRRRAFDTASADALVVTAAWGSWHDQVADGLVGVAARIGGANSASSEEFFFLVPQEEYRAADAGRFIIDVHRHALWHGPDGA